MELSKAKQIAARGFLAAAISLTCSCEKVRTAGPFDRKTALDQSQLNLPLPPSASDVYYLYIDRGTQDQDLFVRFSAEPKDAERLAKADFEREKAFREKIGRPIPDPVIENIPQSTTKKPWGWSSLGLPVWWRPEKIKKGCYIGSKPETFPIRHFWIDEEKSEAFFYGHY